jgi:hypothetical protein
VTALARVPFWAWLALGCALAACRDANAPRKDVLQQLAAGVEHAEIAAPVALAACGLVPEEQRAACVDGAEALAAVAREGRGILATAERCQEEKDSECLAGALERAAEIVRVLRVR